MSIKLKTGLECLSQSGGRRLAEATNFGLVERTGRLGMARSKGDLYVLVEAAGSAKNETERMLVDLLAGEYDRASGSITAGLRQAIAAANRRLYGANQKALPEMRMAAGVTCAVIRDSDIFLAQAGPALSYVLHQGALHRAPVDSPWLSPERAAAFPYMFPLGKRPEIDPDFFHSPLEQGDSVLLCSVALAQFIQQVQVKEILSRGPASAIIDAISSLAGEMDFTAVAMDVQELMEEEEANQQAEAGQTERTGVAGLLGRLREDWQIMLEDVGGFFGRFIPVSRGHEGEELETPAVVAAPRAALPTATAPRADGVIQREAEGERALPPWEAERPAQYRQAGFMADVVAPRGPRPLPQVMEPDRRPYGDRVGEALGAEANLSEPSSDQVDGLDTRSGLNDDLESDRAGQSPTGRMAEVTAGRWDRAKDKVTGALNRLRRRRSLAGEAGQTRGALGRQAPLGEEPETLGASAASMAPTTDGMGVAAARPSGERKSLVGVPWRGRVQGLERDSEPAPSEADEETVDEAADGRRLPWGLRPGWAMAGIAAVAVLAFVVGGVAFIRYQEDQNRAQRFAAFMATAQEKRGLVTPAMDKAVARATLGMAEQAVNQALELRPDDPEAKSFYENLLVTMDGVNSVVRLTSVSVLVDVPETQSKLGRIAVNGIDLFFHDVGQNRVYKYLLASGGTSVQKLDVNPVLMRKGDEVGNVVAGDLVDIAWMPAGGVRTAGRFLALESGGNLAEYDPTGGLRSLAVRDSQTWRKVMVISSFQGNLYVMDTQQNRIFKYEPTTRGYENAPIEWLKAAVDLTNMVDMAIDGDIYLLGLDGRISRFRAGLAATYAMPEMDTPMTNPASLFNTPNTNSVYVVDPGNKRIVQLGKEGGFQRQFRYGGKDGAFDALRSVYVDETQGLMYITSGKKVLVAAIPK
jgi:serine/threonine protein phosphatase PrpC